MEARTQKQLFIGIIFVLILGGIGYGIFDKLALVEATCSDKIQNGKEEGIDCGTLACGVVCQEPAQPLQVSEEKLFRIDSGNYDFVAKIFNPNSSYGAPQISYSVAFDSGTKTGSTYILPGQTKYIVLTSVRTDRELIGAKLKINSVQ